MKILVLNMANGFNPEFKKAFYMLIDGKPENICERKFPFRKFANISFPRVFWSIRGKCNKLIKTWSDNMLFVRW